jgi:hypothetical protein
MNDDYFKITDLSKDFKAWKESKYQSTPQTDVQLWQAMFMLAIAQQVSIVASHLGKIVRTAKERVETE